MNKVVLFLFFGVLVSSCVTQQKTVELANGKMVTQKEYEKMLNHAFKSADREGRKAVKGKLTRKQIREIHENVTVEIDTTN